MAKPKKSESGTAGLNRSEDATQTSGDNTPGSADRERIAERAYQLYVERGGDDGRDLDDWLEAERELVRNRAPEGGNTADSED